MVASFASLALLVTAAGGTQCPPPGFSTQETLNIQWFTSAKWYIHQQQEIMFHPANHLYCNTVDFHVKKFQSLLGYSMTATYGAKNEHGKSLAPWIPKTLCARWTEGVVGKAVIAPCFIPSAWAGDYWVVASDMDEEWALVSGGAPNQQGADGCKSSFAKGGLWIMTRRQQREEEMMQKIRGVAEEKGFDLGVLLDTNHSTCADPDVKLFVPRCQSEGNKGWPRFEHAQELQASNWSGYFEKIYGTVPSKGYPICPLDFWRIDLLAYQAAGITDKVAKETDMTADLTGVDVGDLYKSPWSGIYLDGYWIHHARPGTDSTVGDHTWIEVVHQAVPNEHVGMWFMYAPGSGIWFNTGKSRVFSGHKDAATQLCGGDAWNSTHADDDTVKCAQKIGLDSIQFISTDMPVFNDYFELLAVSLTGSYACGTTQDGVSEVLRAGWMASEQCICDNNQGWVNCNGHGLAPPFGSATLQIAV